MGAGLGESALSQFTCGRPQTQWRRSVDAVLPDAVGLVDAVEVGDVEMDPAGRVRTLVVVHVDGDAARQVVCAMVTTAGLGERLRHRLSIERVGVFEHRRRPLGITSH